MRLALIIIAATISLIVGIPHKQQRRHSASHGCPKSQLDIWNETKTPSGAPIIPAPFYDHLGPMYQLPDGGTPDLTVKIL